MKNTTDNTLRVVECCNCQEKVKVYRGAELPMVSTLVPWGLQAGELPRVEGSRDQSAAVHTDHLPLPPTNLRPEMKSAVIWLVETLLAAKDGEITLVPVGPLTNLGLALRADPRIAKKICRVVMMGGSHNTYPPTQAAEFNVWCDPEAAEIVLQSGIPVTMISLDATSHACLNREQAAQIRAIGTAPAKLCANLIEHRLDASARMGDLQGTGVGVALHDALAVCALVHPDVIKTEHVSCHVDLGRGYAYGETLLNRNYHFEEMPKNCDYAWSADSDSFYQWLYKTLQCNV